MLVPALAAAAAVEQVRGEPASAAGLVKDLEGVMPGPMYALGYLPEIGRVCAKTGELTSLDRLLGRARELDPRLDRFVVSGHAILAEASSEHDRAEALYAEVAARWDEYHCVVEQAHALVGLGRCRLALGRPGEAAAPLEEARVIFARLGAHPLVAETDDLLARAAAPSA
jgi:tetratricopeptide (TPR) repeat protein